MKPFTFAGLQQSFILILILSGCVKDSTDSSSSVDQKVATAKIKLTNAFPHIKAQSPTALLQSPDNNVDWYLVEKSGVVSRINENTSEPPVPFLDIRNRVDSSENESGLLGMAFHPDYAKNHQVFISYTRSGSPLISYVSRFTSVDNGKTLDESSEQVVINVNQPYGNHNGGNIAFGPDNYLYIGFGDGGSGGDPQGNGQNKNTLLGAMLRVNVDGAPPYEIPADNPFVKNSNARPEIYAYGLRNPWRWSFDKKTGQLWLGDVGQNAWEEVDIIESGGNYGWNAKEGFHSYNASTKLDGPGLAPVVEYSHDKGCSITGGYVYRGNLISELSGTYLYADFCQGTIWGLSQSKAGDYQTHILLESRLMIASFAQSNAGELYVLHYGGEIYKIEVDNASP